MGYRGRHENKKPKMDWKKAIAIIEFVAALIQIFTFLASLIKD